MSEQPDQARDATQGPSEPSGSEEPQVVILGPDGQPIASMPASALAGAALERAGDLHSQGAPEGQDRQQGKDDGEAGRALTDLVEQPAKVMRIGTMIRQLLEEVKAAPLDEASRQRLKDIHHASITELEAGLAPELIEELHRLSLPFTDDTTPTEAELRIAQAQLVGWLEGLFHGIQTAMYAQQMATRAQIEQARRALPPGAAAAPGHQHPVGPDTPAEQGERGHGHGGGMYL